MMNFNLVNLRSLLGLATVSMTVGLVACGQPVARLTSPSIETETPGISGLKIGAILPYTGNLAVVGQPMIEVLPLVVDQINACGGVNDQNISLIVEDDQSQKGVAATTLTKLIDTNQIDAAVIGFVQSATPTVIDVAVKNQIPIISSATTSPVFTERAKQGAFQGFWARTVPSDVYQARALARLAIERRYKTAATLTFANDDGLSFEQAFTTTFEELGGTVLNKDFPARYDPTSDTVDYYAAFDAFLPPGGQPDVVVAGLDTVGGATLLKYAYEQGLTQGVQIMLTPSIQPSAFLEQVGKGYDGKYILSGAMGIIPSAAGPAKDYLENLWKQFEQGKPGAFVPQTWDTVALIALAAQAAGSNDGVAIQQHLDDVSNPPGIEVTNICSGLRLIKEGQDINYQGAGGKVDVDENGDVVANYDIWTISDQGKVEVIRQVKFEK